MHAQRLQISTDNISTVAAWRFQYAKGDRINAHNRDSIYRVHKLRYFSTLILNNSEITWILEVERRRSFLKLALQIIQIYFSCHRINFHVPNLHYRCTVIGNDLCFIRIDGSGEQRNPAACNPTCHSDGRGGCLCPVEGRDINYVHIDEFGHQALILEQGLKSAVVFVRLSCISRHELRALINFVAYSRNEMLPAASPEKVDIIGAMLVLRKQSLDMSTKLIFIHSWRKIHLPLKLQTVWNSIMQLVDGAQADFLQHCLTDFRCCIRDIGMGISSVFRQG
ncbi:hypothetical protein D3C71_1223170 [compost metagenome]